VRTLQTILLGPTNQAPFSFQSFSSCQDEPPERLGAVKGAPSGAAKLTLTARTILR